VRRSTISDPNAAATNQFELLVDVTDVVSSGERLYTAATVYVPDHVPADPVSIFAWPGGGYSQRYFDLHLPGRTGYSQAEHHAIRGIVLVTCDHLGVGGSTVPRSSLDNRDLASANAATARHVMSRLREGTLDSELRAMPGLAAVGLGHSYGALLLTLLQADDPVFAGVGFLGWSGIKPVIPCDRAHPLLAVMSDRRIPGLDHPYRAAFHWDDVPDSIVAEDLDGYPYRPGGAPVPAWAARCTPGGPNAAVGRPPRGVSVADEARRIDVPVLIGLGERDIAPDPWAEPSAYRASGDITLIVVPSMAHAHNFAGTRHMLWDRISEWATTVLAGSRQAF
jgi:alpha-beta hydrolase superfamily lysophospholipase